MFGCIEHTYLADCKHFTTKMPIVMVSSAFAIEWIYRKVFKREIKPAV